ncbi:UNVERIFIED_CONTAM: hypothetical protein Sradi_2610000 [Sesamum radiatum]|uniref:Uncharacterized protein n=1 Tax=Sesamum radiatum TaxID=300843 RepID=A0AAW2S4G4_SESRA
MFDVLGDKLSRQAYPGLSYPPKVEPETSSFAESGAGCCTEFSNIRGAAEEASFCASF